MICRKAFERDLAAFVIDPRDPAWAEFREHYPACPDCACEVRVWTELHLDLQSGDGTNGAHPPKELLLDYEERREALEPMQLRSIEGHLASCHACTDELRALRRFDFSALRRPAPPHRARSWKLTRGLPSWLWTAVWHPAFAYALVLVLVLPILMLQTRANFLARDLRIARESRELPRAAQQEAAPRIGEGTGSSPVAAQPVGREAQSPELANHEPIRGAEENPARPANEPSAPGEEDTRLAATDTQPHGAAHTLGQREGLTKTGAGKSRTTGRGTAPEPAGPPALAGAKSAALTNEIASAKSAPSDAAAAGEHPRAEQPNVTDRSKNRSADTQQMEASGTLDGEAPSDGDAGEPHVLGFADTEEPREDGGARHARQTATASAPSAQEVGTDGLWRTILLAPDHAPEVRLGELASGVSLRLPSSALPPAGRDVEIRVVDPGGKDAAHETRRSSSSAEPVEIQIPRDALATGTYRVLVPAKDGATQSDRVSEFRFVVR